MKKLMAIAVFVLCFGVGTAHAQRTGGSNSVPGGGVAGPSNSGGGGSGGGGFGGGGGGGSAISGVTHHPIWVPPANVSAKNDGPFLPSTYQNYDKAVEMGRVEVAYHEPTVVEAARMTQEQRTSTAKSRFVVVQDVDGKLEEVKAQP